MRKSIFKWLAPAMLVLIAVAGWVIWRTVQQSGSATPRDGQPVTAEQARHPAVSYTHLTLPTNREV